MACLSEKGRLLVFGLDECKILSSGGRGVILMDLDPKEKLLAAQAISQKGVVVSVIKRNGTPQDIALSAASLAPHIGKRARKGRALESKLKANACAHRHNGMGPALQRIWKAGALLCLLAGCGAVNQVLRSRSAASRPRTVPE